MLNFVGYIAADNFKSHVKSSTIDLSDDGSESAKESKEEVKNLYVNSEFNFTLKCVIDKITKDAIQADTKLPSQHVLPETPPPDMVIA